MDVPPDIRRPSRKQSLTELMCSVRQITASKTLASGIDHVSKNEWEEALDDLTEARSLYEDLGDRMQISNILSVQGLCLFALGRLDEAVDTMRETVKMKDELGLLEGKATDLLGLGEILLKKGDRENASATFNEAREIFAQLELVEAEDAARDGVDRASLITAHQ